MRMTDGQLALISAMYKLLWQHQLVWVIVASEMFIHHNHQNYTLEKSHTWKPQANRAGKSQGNDTTNPLWLLHMIKLVMWVETT